MAQAQCKPSAYSLHCGSAFLFDGFLLGCWRDFQASVCLHTGFHDHKNLNFTYGSQVILELECRLVWMPFWSLFPNFWYILFLVISVLAWWSSQGSDTQHMDTQTQTGSHPPGTSTHNKHPLLEPSSIHTAVCICPFTPLSSVSSDLLLRREPNEGRRELWDSLRKERFILP